MITKKFRITIDVDVDIDKITDEFIIKNYISQYSNRDEILERFETDKDYYDRQKRLQESVLKNKETLELYLKERVLGTLECINFRDLQEFGYNDSDYELLMPIIKSTMSDEDIEFFEEAEKKRFFLESIEIFYSSIETFITNIQVEEAK